MILDRTQLEAFFQRIGLNYADYENAPLNSAMLDDLCMAASCTMPFENIDILNGKLISLKEEDLYRKMVEEHRGGNCFELNGLCGVLLRSLGFGVEDLFSRFFRDAGDNIPKRRHRLLKVQAEDGVFMWDIGIGMRSPRLPLRLCEGLVQKQFGEIYQFRREPFYGWVLYDFYHDEWNRLISFTEEKQAPIDFVTACVWCELHPESPFNKQYMLSLKTPEGRKTLDGNVYKEFTGNDITCIRELGQEEIRDCLKNTFGIDV